MKFLNIFLFVVIFFLPQWSQSKTVYPYQDIGDGKPATSVILTLVDGVAVDAEGNIFISHRSKNRIRKIDKDGIITTVAGNGIAGYSGEGGPALEAALNFPAGLAFDREGNLYVADRNNHRIRKIDKSGIISTVAGNGVADWNGDDGPGKEASLNYPSGVVLDDTGNLFIADRSNNRIRKVDTKGIITTIAGLGLPDYGGDFGPAEDALLKYPFGITLDGKGNLFIADRGNNRVRKIDQRGIITTIAGDSMHSFAGDYGPATRSSLAYPTDVAVDRVGNIYIADRNNNRIRKIDSLGVLSTFMGTGKHGYNGDNEIAPETTLYLPFALAIDPQDNLIVVDRSHFRVRSVSLKNQSVKTVAGNGESLFKGDGGPGTGATLNTPSGIAIDSRGNILFADMLHNRIRWIDPKGYIHTYAGNGKLGIEGDGGPAVKAALYQPSLMTIDGKDNIYIVNRFGNGWVVRKIDAGGTITHFAGNGRQGNSGDGGPATEASFFAISDIATDRQGNVYLSDTINKSIRKIGGDGIIHSIFDGKFFKNLGEEVHPNGLVVDEAGNVYFSDSGSSNIRKLDPAGMVTTVAGSGAFADSGDGGSAIKAGIRSPGGLVLGPDGSLFVAEETTSHIRKINRDGVITRIAGTSLPGYNGDELPAIAAQIKSPFRMVFDSKGNLYFSDRDNNRIRKIDTRGKISTLAGHSNIGWMQDGLEVRITVHHFP